MDPPRATRYNASPRKGNPIRHRGLKKDDFDLGRRIVVRNCHVLDGL